jgi:hypothetical protein
MKKNTFSMLILLLVAVLVLSACDAIDDYSRRDRGVGIPATGDTAFRNDNMNDNNDAVRNDNLNDNRDAVRNDNLNDNRNDNLNDNRNDNLNDNRNDNWNDNANDNAARERDPGVPLTGDDRIARNNLYRVDELTGQTLETRDGVPMGRIDSLLVHPVTGRIHYLVLEPDRDLNVDRDYLLVPWGALHTWSANPYEGVPPGQLPPPEQREPMNCRDLPPGHLPPPHLRDELCLDYDDLRDDRGLVFGFGRDTMERSPSYTSDHQRFTRTFAHQDADRIPIIDEPWDATIERWQREGMPAECLLRRLLWPGSRLSHRRGQLAALPGAGARGDRRVYHRHQRLRRHLAPVEARCLHARVPRLYHR